MNESKINENKKTIIIIGAGLAGLCTALSLSRLGHYRIELIEKRKDFSEKGATYHISQNGIKALEELFPGIVEDCLSKVGIYMENGALMLCIWDVRHALLERVLEDDNITLRMGCQIEKIYDNPKESQVEVSFHNFDNLIISGKLVIAADGVNSTVRRLVGLPEARKVGTTYWRGSIDAYQTKPESKLRSLLENMVISKMLVGDKTTVSLFNFHPKKGGRIGWVLMTKKEKNDIESTPHSLIVEMNDTEKKELIQEVFNVANKEELNAQLDLAYVDLTDECFQNMKGWGGRGRITFIGDAAHALMPTEVPLLGGLAFEDSVILTKTLASDRVAESLDSYEFCNELIEGFEMGRLDRVKTISIDQAKRAQTVPGEKLAPWTEDFEKWVFQGV